MRKILITITVTIAVVLAAPGAAFAHVVVTPNQADVGDRILFNVSVPNEKEVAVNSIKLDIPNGVQNVQPNVTAGWNIATTTDKSGDVTSITWTGNIPVGQRADLEFKAQAPAAAKELDWKAYQTYANGEVVHWDQKPTVGGNKDNKSDAGPYSVTKVVNDLASNNSTSEDSSNKNNLAFVFSVAALAISVGGLFLQRKK